MIYGITLSKLHCLGEKNKQVSLIKLEKIEAYGEL